MTKELQSPKIIIKHLIPGLEVGGAERVVLNHHLAFESSPVDSGVIYWNPDPEMLDTPAFQKLRPKTCRLLLKKVISPSSVIKLFRYLRQSKTQLLHTHLMDADLLGFLAARLLGIQHVITIHSYPFPFIKKHCLRYKVMSMLGTYIVCVSDTVRKHVLEAAGIRPSRISTIMSGINLAAYIPGEEDKHNDLRREFGINDHAFVVGCVSRLVRDKGHEFLLGAVPRVLKQCPNAVFVIAGDGALREPLMENSRQLGVEKHVLFIGQRTDVPRVLSIMDVFAYPSLHEALTTSIMEAMAAAKPIISANFTAVTELISDGKDGILVPLANAEALADAIIDLYNAPDKRNSLAAAACKRAQSFSMFRTAQQLESLYQSLVNHKKTGVE